MKLLLDQNLSHRLIKPLSEVFPESNQVALLDMENQHDEFHRVVYRPWGHYDSIDSGERFQVKRITVKPGEKLSVQMHHHRAEHWVVVSGTLFLPS